jgi:polysaccharide biosynthesis/export protein
METLRYRLAVALLTGLGCIASGAVSSQEAPAEAPADADDSEYLIGPGDTLQVFVWRNPELTTTIPVRPDGKISTPLVEDMVAVGKTPSQLARDIEAVLAEYIRQPKVNVILSNAVSSFSQVKVIGQVTTPQAIPFREGMTVMDAVLAVGGLGTYAAGNRAKLLRSEGGEEKELSQNLPLQPGDVIVVPESRF